MYKVKKVGTHWLISHTDGQFHRLPFSGNVKNVEVLDNFVVSDESIYEIQTKDNRVYIEIVPDAVQQSNGGNIETQNVDKTHENQTKNSTSITTFPFDELEAGSDEAANTIVSTKYSTGQADLNKDLESFQVNDDYIRTGLPKPDNGKQRDTQVQLNKYKSNEQKQNDEVMNCYAEIIVKTGSAKEEEQLFKRINFQDVHVHRVTFSQIKQLKEFARNNHVFITLDTDLGAIELVGLHKNLIVVYDGLYSLLGLADQPLYLRERAQLMSNVIKWIYIKGNKEYPFTLKMNLEIETAYRKKDKKVRVKDMSGGEYEIDFGTLEEYDVKNPQQKFPIIRRDPIAGASFDIPKRWKAMAEKDNLILVQLNQSDQEYQAVYKEFTSTLGRTPNVVRIDRIQNKTLYTQYAAKRKEMDMNNTKKKNERTLWHGTAHNAVPSINSHGFNRSYCGKNAVAIGEGVYFAVQSSYSDQSTYSPPGSDGNKRMYRCLVLTGKYCNGSHGMRVPPPIDASKPHILYDSVANSTSSPIMFVVFNDTQAYPEHIITYR